MNQEIFLAGRRIAADSPVFIVAEMSANHLQDYDRAVRILHAAKEAGADAVKLQTYTADTITFDSDDECFQITGAHSGTALLCTDSTKRPIRPGNGTPG